MDPWEQAWAIRVHHFGAKISFCRPAQTLPISLTGSSCALDCAHCGRYYLESMTAIENADVSGYRSCLISGGCDARGRVPVTTHLEEMRRWHPGRRFNWHVGLIDEVDLQTILPLVDVVSFDVVGDEPTIREVYGIERTTDEYLATYKMLREYVRVVPHLTLGLRGGKFSGEYKALDMLQTAGLSALVLLVFIPTPGTRYAACTPPPQAQVVDFLLHARAVLPDVPILLGCMRPGGKYRRELDSLAVRAGVNTIVNPAPSAIQTATELGLTAHWEDECCVI